MRDWSTSGEVERLKEEAKKTPEVQRIYKTLEGLNRAIKILSAIGFGCILAIVCMIMFSFANIRLATFFYVACAVCFVISGVLYAVRYFVRRNYYTELNEQIRLLQEVDNNGASKEGMNAKPFEEYANEAERATVTTEESAATVATRAPEPVAVKKETPRAAEKRPIEKERSVDERVSSMRKYVALDLCLIGLLLLFFLAMCLPYINFFGERYTLLASDKVEQGLENPLALLGRSFWLQESFCSVIGYANKPITFMIAFISFYYVIILCIIGITAIVCLLVYAWKLVLALCSCRTNIRDQRIQLSRYEVYNAPRHRKQYRRTLMTSLFGWFICEVVLFALYVVPFVIWIGKDVGSEFLWEIVSPMIIVFPMLCLVAFLALWAWKRRAYKNNEQIEKDKTFIAAYRPDLLCALYKGKVNVSEQENDTEKIE